MTVLRYTLLSDGSSDAALIPIITWLILEHRADLGVLGQLAEPLDTQDRSLECRIPAALAAYPCDILFVHRDAESEPAEKRLKEIQAAVGESNVNYVPIIPIKMTESWLFSDEAAIRSASENRNGEMPLNLPAKKSWECLADPKGVLFETLVIASGKKGRALSKFNPHRQRQLVSQRTSDFSALRGLSSFDRLELQLIQKLKAI